MEALSSLDAADVAIGAAEDGGYYLLALREPRPELLSGIAWSTKTVAAETRARAAELRLTVREIATLRDLDTLDDLRAEWSRLGGLLEARPALRDALQRHVDLVR